MSCTSRENVCQRFCRPSRNLNNTTMSNGVFAVKRTAEGSRTLMFHEDGRCHSTWSPSEHGAAVDEVRVLSSQLLKTTYSLWCAIVTAETTAQQSQKRVLELAIEHRVDDRVEGTGHVAQPQEHLAVKIILVMTIRCTDVSKFFTIPSTRRHVVGQVAFVTWSKIDVPSTAVNRRSDRLVLLDSKHSLQILQQLRTTLISLTVSCPTTWRQACGSAAIIPRIKIEKNDEK